MSGYCLDCGNTMCVCEELRKEPVGFIEMELFLLFILRDMNAYYDETISDEAWCKDMQVFLTNQWMRYIRRLQGEEIEEIN